MGIFEMGPFCFAFVGVCHASEYVCRNLTIDKKLTNIYICKCDENVCRLALLNTYINIHTSSTWGLNQMQYKHTCIPPNMQQDMLLSCLHILVNATGSKLDEVWWLNDFIFSVHTGHTLGLSTTVGHTTWMKWYSKMDTTTSLSKDNLGKHTTGTFPRKQTENLKT
jgi:hypothetical protein